MKKVLFLVVFLLCLNCCKLTVSADEGFTKFLQEIQPEEITCIEYTVPEYSGFKSYMSYKLFSKKTLQYKLQQIGTTDDHGFRRIGEYYVIAVGNYFDVRIGQRVDLKLENGETIKCVIGDKKANKDTDKSNLFSKNDCLSEFIVDMKTLDKAVKERGDVSFFPEEEWNSPVTKVLVYEEFLMED